VYIYIVLQNYFWISVIYNPFPINGFLMKLLLKELKYN